jgi:recombination protein RecA
MRGKLKEKPVEKPTSFAENDEKMKAMLNLVNKASSWQKASEVLTPVRAMPTIFPQLNLVTTVGGWPIERFTLIHGPSSQGKTSLCIGLGRSFLTLGNFFLYIDAEYTTPETWLKTLMGEYAESPLFLAKRPLNYEETVDSVREFLVNMIAAKRSGELPLETSALIVVDSLRKLAPKGLLAAIAKGSEDDDGPVDRKSKKKGVDGAGGRAGQKKAAMNAAWLDELVPLLAQAGAAMIAVAREAEDPDAGMWDEGFKVGGGTAINYDSSLVVRVCSEKPLREGGESTKIYGERHRIEIRKTKIGGKTERRPVAWFHTSNGEFFKSGFLRAMDVFEMAVEDDIIEAKGSWFNYGQIKLGQGQNNSVKCLDADLNLLNEIESKIIAKRSSK